MAAIEDISGRKRMELDLQERTDLLSAVAHALNVYLENGNWNLASRELLSFVIGKTNSEYGFLGVMFDDGTLRVLGLDGSVWNEPLNRSLHEDTVRRYHEEGSPRFSGLQQLFAQGLFSGQLVVCNQCAEAHSASVPVAYPPLNSFLGVPISRAAAVAGFIAIANRTSGYSGTGWNR
jgi:GAF domain-containing protein